MQERVGAVLALLMCVGVAVAPESRAASARLTYVITTTTGRATAFAVDLRAQAEGDGGFVAVFVTSGAGTRRQVLSDGIFAMEFGGETSVRVGTGGTVVDTCAAAMGTCQLGQTPGTFAFRQNGSARIGPDMAVYVAVDAATVDLALGKGLRVRVMDGAFRRVTGESVDDAHVSIDRAHAARFTHAAVAGGPRGSVAVGAVPCEVRGEGTAGLFGEGSRALSCGSAQSAAASMVARARVTWRLEGETTGVSVTRTRLAVVDLI